jgi:hypothetical protein
MAGASFFFGVSATMASVVIMRPATDAASCRATRTTLAGSTMPAFSMSTYLFGLSVEAVSLRLVLKHLADDDRTLHARVLRDLADWRLKRPEHDVDAGLDVGILVAELADRRLGAQQRDAAAGHDAFLDDTPMAVLIRQVLGAVAQFEKASPVAKLAAVRKRTGRHGGQKSSAKLNPAAVEAARRLKGKSLRAIAELAAQRFVSQTGKPFVPTVVACMLRA